MSEPPDLEHIHCIAVPTPYPVGPVNCYLIEGASPALVDCGPASAEAEQVLRQGLQDRRIRLADLDVIVLTHHHPDHAGGLGWLRRETRAVLLGHPRNDFWLAGDAEDVACQTTFFSWLYHYCDAPIPMTETTTRLVDNVDSAGHARVTRPLVEGDAVDLGGERWRIHETPGHAGSSISLIRRDGVCLIGDTLLHRISSNALAEPGYDGEGRRHPSLPLYRRSLSRLAALDLSIILPGHGPSFAGHAELIERRLHGQDERAKRLLDALDIGGQTARELAYVLFPGLPAGQLFLGLSEVLGHLDLLEDGGHVYHEGESPARYFTRDRS